jgi:hypothetical protein
MNLIEEIKKRSSHVDEGISEMLPITHPEELYKAARYLPDAGGKRLRPAAVILAAEAVGSDLQTVLPAAVAVELVHISPWCMMILWTRTMCAGECLQYMLNGRACSYPCRRYSIFQGF